MIIILAFTVAATWDFVAGNLAGGEKADANGVSKGTGMPSAAASTPLHVPFGAVALQQLANAALASRKVSNDKAWDVSLLTKPVPLNASNEQSISALVLLASLVHFNFKKEYVHHWCAILSL